MGAQSGGVIPDGYVTNGLVFFLDGLQNLSANEWTDIVGGKKFVLYSCTLNNTQSGVVFDGTNSYGECSGTITDDWENETIEAVIDRAAGSTPFVFNQPKIDDKVGISLVFGSLAYSKNPVGIGVDGASHQQRWSLYNNKLLGVNNDRCISDKTAMDVSNTDSWSANNVGVTTVGARCNANKTKKLTGTIYAIRIYNRKLSEAEILQNQTADMSRYGITI